MKTLEQQFELDTKILGKNAMAYMADLLRKNEKQELEIERGKLAIGVLKQMNNRSRTILDAHKYALKKAEADKEAYKANQN